VKTIVHVNQHVIRRNIRAEKPEPVLTVKKGRENVYAHRVRFTGPGEVVYSPNKPLKCGARVWLETEFPVEIIE